MNAQQNSVPSPIVNTDVATSDHIVERTDRSLVHSEMIAARSVDGWRRSIVLVLMRSRFRGTRRCRR